MSNVSPFGSNVCATPLSLTNHAVVSPSNATDCAPASASAEAVVDSNVDPITMPPHTRSAFEVIAIARFPLLETANFVSELSSEPKSPGTKISPKVVKRTTPTPVDAYPTASMGSPFGLTSGHASRD